MNKERKANKNDWVVLQEEVEDTKVQIKFYNTWVQLMYIGNNGIKYSSGMDLNVKQFNEFLRRVVNDGLYNN